MFRSRSRLYHRCSERSCVLLYPIIEGVMKFWITIASVFQLGVVVGVFGCVMIVPLLLRREPKAENPEGRDD
jgi:hypothetical protein